VTNLNDAGPGSLRQAIDDSRTGDTVDFEPGLTGTITLTSGELRVFEGITIAGPGADAITINAGRALRVFNLGPVSPMVISGLTITGGTSGGIYNATSSLTIRDCVITGNRGARGAGLSIAYSTVTVIDSVIRDNTSTDRGGGVYVDSGSTLIVTDSTLSGNTAQYFGGGIYNDAAGTVMVMGSTLRGNSAGYGGGLYDFVSTMTVAGSVIDGNTAFNGGGIDELGGRLTVSDSTITGNSSRFDGGGFYFESQSNATITGSTVSGNDGGAIFITSSTVAVTGSVLSDNTGVAVYNGASTLTITDSTIRGNHGGGLYNLNSRLTLTGSTVNDNVGSSGAGIFNDTLSTLTVTNSTISNNTAADNGGGVYSADSAVFTNCTISGNAAHDGGGIYKAHGLLNLRNTIVAGNTADTSPDVDALLLQSLGHNLIGDGHGSSGFAASDLVGTSASPIDPLLGPLQDNGGSTPTMIPLPGSPAVDAGDNANAPAFDQRGPGYDRIVGGTIDIGAVEAQPGPATSFYLDAPAATAPGVPFDLTVYALDDYGHVATGYRGTVTFTTTDPDPAVVLPVDYTFTADDAGVHTFAGGFTLVTPGDQTIAATDTGADGLTGSATVTVAGNGPPTAHRPGRPHPASAPAWSRGPDPAQELMPTDGWLSVACGWELRWAGPACGVRRPDAALD
jgi:parallel beta-helix repeat protein